MSEVEWENEERQKWLLVLVTVTHRTGRLSCSCLELFVQLDFYFIVLQLSMFSIYYIAVEHLYVGWKKEVRNEFREGERELRDQDDDWKATKQWYFCWGKNSKLFSCYVCPFNNKQLNYQIYYFPILLLYKHTFRISFEWQNYSWCLTISIWYLDGKSSYLMCGFISA